MTASHIKLPRSARARRGQALVEFAMIALVMYLLLAAMLEYGRAIFAAQVLQSAADLAAREISRTPLPPLSTLPDALAALKGSAENPPRLYSEDYLVIQVQDRVLNDELLGSLPIVNQQLVPLMFFDQISGVDVLRYPGALVTSATAPSGYTVKVPYLRSTSGVETIDWHDVVEPISSTDSFSVTSPDRGVVALRINYPFQAASLSSFPDPVEGEFPRPRVADDAAVEMGDTAALDGGTPVAADVAQPDRFGARYGSAMSGTTYAGQYGLGVHGAMGQPARPFRKIISAQAVYRREVFDTQPSSTSP